MTAPSRTLHIGIVCDYDFTLLPNSGIGVFVYNLIEGLLTLTPRPQITLLANPGDQEKLKDWAQRRSDRVTISPSLEQGKTVRVRLERLVRYWDQRCLSVQDVIRTGCGRLATSWVSETIVFPIHLAHRVFQKMSAIISPLKTRVAAAGCDVWLVPFPGTREPILAPHVLVIFDMVFRHVPEVYSAQKRKHAECLFAARARQATLIYCGSNFVKEHDLVPSFPFAADRIRVFRLAPPMDLRSEGVILDRTNLCRKYGIGNEFLFYPAGLRAHKNHSTLVRALRLLRQNYGHRALELVLTGEERQSRDLLRLVQSEGLTEHVHFLGLISRQDVQAFYQHALLVPLPSLHEGYGLPLLEALQSQCPIVCADIPAFRELLDDQADAVLFFDRYDAESMAQAISHTIARRAEIRDRQREAFRRIARRDWQAVAQDFLQILEEAYHLSAESSHPSSTTFGMAPEKTIHHAA